MEIRNLYVKEDITTEDEHLTPVVPKKECALVVDMLYTEDSIALIETDIIKELEPNQVKFVRLEDGRYDVHVNGYVWYEKDIRSPKKV